MVQRHRLSSFHYRISHEGKNEGRCFRTKFWTRMLLFSWSAIDVTFRTSGSDPLTSLKCCKHIYLWTISSSWLVTIRFPHWKSLEFSIVNEKLNWIDPRAFFLSQTVLFAFLNKRFPQSLHYSARSLFVLYVMSRVFNKGFQELSSGAIADPVLNGLFLSGKFWRLTIWRRKDWISRYYYHWLATTNYYYNENY